MMCSLLTTRSRGCGVDDEANGRWFKFLDKHDPIEIARAKWLALLGRDYDWFWDVYSENISYYDLDEKDYVELYDLYEIVKFINPEAIKLMSKNERALRCHIMIRENATECLQKVSTRHHLFYAWRLFGWRQLHKNYPFYYSGQVQTSQSLTKWAHKALTVEEFLQKELFFLEEQTDHQDREYAYNRVDPSTEKKLLKNLDADLYYGDLNDYNGMFLAARGRGKPPMSGSHKWKK